MINRAVYTTGQDFLILAYFYHVFNLTSNLATEKLFVENKRCIFIVGFTKKKY